MPQKIWMCQRQTLPLLENSIIIKFNNLDANKLKALLYMLRSWVGAGGDVCKEQCKQVSLLKIPC
ncbi:MAG: hypothetical protein ACRCSB_05830 [Bacteroidales bacterium]